MAKRKSSDEKISTSFKVDKRLHVRLKVAAAKQDREMGELVEEALIAYLRNHGEAA